MTTKIQTKYNNNSSSDYKMNSTDFWQHTRSSLNINDQQQNNLINLLPASENHLQNLQTISPLNQHTPNNINTVLNNHQLITPKPEGPVSTSSSLPSLPTNGSTNNNNNTTTPNGQLIPGNMQLQLPHQNNNNHLINQHTRNLQQHPSQSPTPAENSIPENKLNTEKLVSEFQQLSRSNNSAAAISERTLEECWSTLQRIFMHKSAMQMQHARDLQRVGGNSAVGGGIVGNTVANTTSNPSQVGGGGGGSVSGSIMATEVKPHQCQQCLKSFSSNHQLVQHIRVHTGEKPYKCHFCERRFKQLSHVQQHTRLHTGERPYKCHLPDCGRAFIQLSNLQQHLRNHDAQVERAKNRPFHCNICGKGFATESSLRTHTSKSMREGGCDGMGELQVHLGVLQQHAALIGGPNATSCPICHKLFLGSDALMEHMKHAHKEPNSAGVAKKRRTSNHPCPVCGKHYINEGSLRKHLACHPETAQLTSNLRMWPCSVCQAVFTHEGGLLTHMEHMRMDPKHQFAAQYVLSRAAAERRERDTILAAAVAVSASGSGLLGMGSSGGQNSLCASPSAQSDCSSNNGNGRLSSTGSDTGLVHNHNNNNTNINNNNNTSNNNNNNTENNNKLNELLRNNGGNNGHLLQQQQQYGNNCDDLHLNRITGGIVPNSNNENESAVSLATAMRTGRSIDNSATNGPNSPHAINAENTVLHSSAIPDGTTVHMTTQHLQIHQNTTDTTIRMHQHAEALLRSQALRLAVSQATANAANNNNNNNSINNNINNNNNNNSSSNSNDINNVNNQLRHQHQNGNSNSSGGCSGNTNNNSYSCTSLNNNNNYNNFNLIQHQK